MVAFQGRAEVIRRQQQLDATFKRIDGADLSIELVADFGRYCCVLVSGFAEQSLVELGIQYTRRSADPRVQRYASRVIGRLQNVNAERMKQYVEAFDPDWWLTLSANRADEIEAFTSVVAIRNAVAHGQPTGVTMNSAGQYFKQVAAVLKDLCDLFDPV